MFLFLSLSVSFHLTGRRINWISRPPSTRRNAQTNQETATTGQITTLCIQGPRRLIIQPVRLAPCFSLAFAAVIRGVDTLLLSRAANSRRESAKSIRTLRESNYLRVGRRRRESNQLLLQRGRVSLAEVGPTHCRWSGKFSRAPEAKLISFKLEPLARLASWLAGRKPQTATMAYRYGRRRRRRSAIEIYISRFGLHRASERARRRRR